LDDRVLPAPSRVATAGWADRDDLARNVLPTMRSVAVGFLVSVSFAFVLSVLLDRSRWARRAIVPLLIGSQTLPIIVLAPLMVLWFGFGLTPKVVLVALVTFFPIVVALVDGYASSDRDATTLLRTMGAGWWTGFRLLRLPSALPRFFTGLRIAITYAVVAAIFAEYAGAFSGLAVYLQGAQSSGRTDLVLAAVVVSSALTLGLYALTIALERLTVPWYHQTRAAVR
jgi:ABC-type nitrate/sulfonate/bicarbonate transport system permease component